MNKLVDGEWTHIKEPDREFVAVIDQDAERFSTKAYVDNPVLVSYRHGKMEVIGRCLEIWKDSEGRLVGRFKIMEGINLPIEGKSLPKGFNIAWGAVQGTPMDLIEVLVVPEMSLKEKK